MTLKIGDVVGGSRIAPTDVHDGRWWIRPDSGTSVVVIDMQADGAIPQARLPSRDAAERWCDERE